MKENGREARRCYCQDEICEGWQMAHIREAQWAADNGFASLEELAWLAEGAAGMVDEAVG